MPLFQRALKAIQTAVMKQLTHQQHTKFQKAHRRLLLGLSFAVVYCMGIVLLGKVFPLDRFGLWITIGLFPLTALVIWCMHGFRCPVCSQVPRARMWAFGGGEVQYSSMVALFPRDCSSCGVQFTTGFEAVDSADKTEGGRL